LLSVTSVKFENQASSSVFSIVSGTRINVTVPSSGSGITTGVSHIVIDKPPFSITSTATFTYNRPPSALVVYSPALDAGINGGYGSVATVVELQGSDLNVGGFPTVTFGGIVGAVSSALATSVIVTVPNNAGNGIVLTTVGGSTSVGFTTLRPVSISSFYTSGYYDHHAAAPYFNDTVDVYGSNFRDSGHMSLVIICPALGNASLGVSFTFYDSTHIRFVVQTLGTAGFYDNCYITLTTSYPGGTYYTNVYGLNIYYPIL